jgi:glycosyltransferase involved in cell wall biosynthesis
MAAALAGQTANDHQRLARDAVSLGCAALQSGDVGRAIPFLERAYRLAPRDPTTALLLAGADPARAETLLCAALSHHPGHRAILAALAAAALRDGNPAQAAARLHAMLSTGAPLPGADFIDLANRIARDSGAPGWIALSGDGRLLISGRGVRLRVGGVQHPAPGAATRTLALADGWQAAGTVTAEKGGAALIGSPIDIGALLLVEGCITGQTEASLTGWAWHPNDPDRPVVLRLVDAGGIERARLAADLPLPKFPGGDGADRDTGFCFDLSGLPATATWPLQVRGPDAGILPGGAVHAGEAAASRAAAAALAADPPTDPWRPIPAMVAAAAGLPPRAAAGRGATIILPLDGETSGLVPCLVSMTACGASVVAVTPVRGAEATRHLVEGQGGVLIEVPGAAGPALLNAGLRHAMQGRAKPFVLLLAAPVIVPPDLTRRMAALLRAEPGAGLVQPLIVPADDAAARDRMARRCNAGLSTALTLTDSAILGLDMRCVRQTGLLRDRAFAGVAAALTDFSARAAHLGWRSILAGDCCVGMPQDGASPHVREALAARDRAALERLHPGIGPVIEAQQRADPGAEARRRIAIAGWAAGARAGALVIFVTHADGGGVERHVRQSAAAVRAQGGRACVIRAGGDERGAFWSLSDGTADADPDLRFRAPGEFAALADLLRMARPVLVQLHHAESHDQAICGLAPALGVPYDVFVHDFAMICPRVTLIGGTGRYCGEPADVTECDACVADHGVRIGEAGPVAGLRARTAALAAGARRIVAPSRDAARRILRQWRIDAPPPQIEPWEDDAALAADVPRRPVRASAPGPVTICLAGAFGQDKGFDVLLACARDAARRQLNLAFRVVGHTIDDGRLIDTGRVFITGEYEEHEAVALIRAQHADIGFLPSVWPETWCYALSALWRAGLWTLAFALGAQAERIAATGAGRTVPLGLPAGRLNDLFLGLFPAGVASHG